MTKDRVIHGTGDPVFDAIAASFLGEKKELKDIADLNTDQFLDINEEQMKGLSQEELEIVTKLYEVDIDARTREVQSIVDYVAELLTKATALMSDLDVAKLAEAATTYQKTYAPAKEEEVPQPKTEAGRVTAAQISQTINSNDNLMNPIIWGNLIDTVNANEPVVDEAAVMNTFRNMLNSNATDARTALKANMARVIEMAKHE